MLKDAVAIAQLEEISRARQAQWSLDAALIVALFEKNLHVCNAKLSLLRNLDVDLLVSIKGGDGINWRGRATYLHPHSRQLKRKWI